MRWILQRRTNGGVKTDAPVFAAGNFRTFQCGNESFHKCLAIVETPFPYPYAQGTMVMLLLWCLCSPFMVCEIVNNDAYAIFTAGVTSMAFALLNEVRPLPMLRQGNEWQGLTLDLWLRFRLRGSWRIRSATRSTSSIWRGCRATSTIGCGC